jgi:hypothetical protein
LEFRNFHPSLSLTQLVARQCIGLSIDQQLPIGKACHAAARWENFLPFNPDFPSSKRYKNVFLSYFVQVALALESVTGEVSCEFAAEVRKASY